MARLFHSNLQVSEELMRRLRDAPEPTEADHHEQRISFAYGNLPEGNPLTKDDVRREAERIYGPPPKD